jgi:hypothetical protein
MNADDAIRLQEYIEEIMPKWKPQAHRIGNGEWVVRLINAKIVWSAQDWNENFVGQPSRKIEEEQVSA